MHHIGGISLRSLRDFFIILCIASIVILGSDLHTVAAAALPAPGPLIAIPASHAVTLVWQPVDGAARYRLYRSYTSGAYFDPIVEVVAGVGKITYTDTGLINQAMLYYTLTAIDGAGGESAASPEVAAMPNPQVSSVYPPQPISIIHAPLSDAPVLIRASFQLDDPTVPLYPAAWLKAEVRLGDASQPPAQWGRRYPGYIYPPANGTQTLSIQAQAYPGGMFTPADIYFVACFSTDGGLTWTFSGSHGKILQPDQPQPVSDLGVIHLTVTTGSAFQTPAPSITPGVSEITFSWASLAIPGLAGIDIFRLDEQTNYHRLVGRVTPTAPEFTDGALEPHHAYTYAIQAFNTAYRYPDTGLTYTVSTLDAEPVTVTLRVHVPSTAKDAVYITRNIDNLTHLPFTQQENAQQMACDWSSLTCSLDLTLQKGVLFSFAFTRGLYSTIQTLPDGNTPPPDTSFIVPQQPGVIERVVYAWTDPMALDHTPHSGLARVGQPISVLWNQPIRPPTSYTQVTVERLDPGAPPVAVPGQSSLSADQRRLFFTPDQPLSGGAVYRVTVEYQEDIYGNVQHIPVVWEFTAACCSINLPVIQR